MCPQVEVVTSRLRRTRRRWWTFSLWTGVVLGISFSVGILMLFVLADAMLRLPQAVIGGLFLAWAGASLAAVALLIARLRRGRRSLAATARRIELTFPELESHLINLVQFAERAGDGSPADAFRQASLAQAAAAVAEFPFDRTETRQSRWRRFAFCTQTPRDLLESSLVLGAILAFALLLGAIVPAWASSVRRMAHPFRFVPSVGSVRIVEVRPGDVDVLLGSSLEIVARIENPSRKARPATLFVREAGKAETAVAMIPDAENRTYLAARSQVLAPLEYRLQIGDTQTSYYRVSVYEKPTIADVEVAYDYPAYLGRPRATIRQDHADLEAPQFTRAEMRIHPSTPIAHGHLLVEGRSIDGEVIDGGRTLLARLMLEKTTTFTIHLFTSGEHYDPQPRLNRAMVQADAPPVVQLVDPAGEKRAAPGTSPMIVVRAHDESGLGLVRLEARTQDAGAAEAGSEARPFASWSTFASSGVVLSRALNLDSSRYRTGQTVWVRAVAQDRREMDLPGRKLGPQESATPWQPIRIVPAEDESRADLARLDDLHAALGRILQDQLRARAVAAGLTGLTHEAEAGKLAGDVRGRQAAIQKASTAVIASIGSADDPGRIAIKRVVNKLAFGDMILAIRRAEALEQIASIDQLAGSTTDLLAIQDRIIDVLRRLVGEVRRETADRVAELKKRPGTELPSDAQEKLRGLKDRLQEFLRQQKKVIEATENLAKKPVEDYSEEDRRHLKEMAASEDEWSRFLAEQHSDLSKLPEQDFANPSLLKELVELQTELAMARDALTRKTVEIAVPLEQLGAEMAKEMTTNIERWLPDTPDRERWSQEEPLTDAMKEAPMAELPKELEDIVGKLMEDEQDLFDEMEDASSSWADSLDKGAGWDAMDGPISNNSARGVTGNRLPNSSEIGGRSGEGRQGRAHGEFVGDLAEGKGGRKTPSRLTPDPYVKGRIKDTSKDPVGGATGGGKESGQGGTGLHGPVPDRPARQMGRLAAKQAQLRNRAEGVNLRFQVLQYHHTDLQKLIGVMAAVEGDLEAGRYRNALRRRDVLLEGIGQIKTYLEGEFVVRQDRTANLPTDIQKEILGSMQEPSPRGWDDLNRQYFERLTSSPAAAAAPRAKAPGTAAARPSGKK